MRLMVRLVVRKSFLVIVGAGEEARSLVGKWGCVRAGLAGGRVGSGWCGGLGADAGVSPDDAEAADAVEVDGGGSPFEPVAGFGEAGVCPKVCVTGVV